MWGVGRWATIWTLLRPATGLRRASCGGSGLHGAFAFVPDVFPPAAIARFDLASGRREDLTTFDHPTWNHRDGHHPHPVCSPDGRRIYFNAAPGGRCGCYALDLTAISYG